MITCRLTGDEFNNRIIGENFHDPKNWSYEFLDRTRELSKPIQRFRCKDRKNNIHFYYLEFPDNNDNDKRYFLFKSVEDRTLFLLTYF